MAWPLMSLRQGVDHEALGRARGPTGGNHRDVLFAIFPEIGHGYGGAVQVQRLCPQFLPGPGIEGAEFSIIRGSDENQSTARYNRATAACRSDILLSFGHAIVNSKRYLPRNVSGI